MKPYRDVFSKLEKLEAAASMGEYLTLCKPLSKKERDATAKGAILPADLERMNRNQRAAVEAAMRADTLWVQYQSVDGFTPSANSTTLIGRVRGFQARA